MSESARTQSGNLFKWLLVMGLFWFLYQIREVFPPFIVGGIIAYLLIPVVNSMSASLKIKPAISVGILYIGFAITVFLPPPGLANRSPTSFKRSSPSALT